MQIKKKADKKKGHAPAPVVLVAAVVVLVAAVVVAVEFKPSGAFLARAVAVVTVALVAGVVRFAGEPVPTLGGVLQQRKNKQAFGDKFVI